MYLWQESGPLCCLLHGGLATRGEIFNFEAKKFRAKKFISSRRHNKQTKPVFFCVFSEVQQSQVNSLLSREGLDCRGHWEQSNCIATVNFCLVKEILVWALPQRHPSDLSKDGICRHCGHKPLIGPHRPAVWVLYVFIFLVQTAMQDQVVEEGISPQEDDEVNNSENFSRKTVKNRRQEILRDSAFCGEKDQFSDMFLCSCRSHSSRTLMFFRIMGW